MCQFICNRRTARSTPVERSGYVQFHADHEFQARCMLHHQTPSRPNRDNAGCGVHGCMVQSYQCAIDTSEFVCLTVGRLKCFCLSASLASPGTRFANCRRHGRAAAQSLDSQNPDYAPLQAEPNISASRRMQDEISSAALLNSTTLGLQATGPLSFGTPRTRAMPVPTSLSGISRGCINRLQVETLPCSSQHFALTN